MPILRHIYDPATGTYVDIEVSNAVYNCYRRTAWSIRYNDRQFYAHEIQFSSLLGGSDGALENFREFLSEEMDPEYILCLGVPEQALSNALAQLTPAELQLLQALALDGQTEREYARQTGLPQKTVHNRKARAIRTLKQHLLQRRS